MRKILVQFRRTQHAAGSLVYFAARHARLYYGNCSLLRLQYGIIRELFLPARLAHVDSARHIRTITIEDNTEVERHEAASGHLRRRGSPMRKRRPPSRSHDRLK